jgi:hypothetical protein
MFVTNIGALTIRLIPMQMRIQQNVKCNGQPVNGTNWQEGTFGVASHTYTRWLHIGLFISRDCGTEDFVNDLITKEHCPYSKFPAKSTQNLS